jgi:hypothetical protein
MTDWRLAEHRWDVFLDSWEFHLMFGTLPGCVQHLLPAIAADFALDDDGRAWLTWLNGNTQNPAMSLLLLEASDGDPANWRAAVDFWQTHYADMQWDTDRRHQKSKFGEATAALMLLSEHHYGAEAWYNNGTLGWGATWKWALSLPHMGRLSAWSMIEYARILFGRDAVPDADDLMLRDAAGSKSHRNGLAVVAAYPGAEYWTWPDAQPIIEALEDVGERLLTEMQARRPEASRLDLESALCTMKGWFKPNRRYPNVYADMAYLRLKKAEERFGPQFGTLWRARAAALPSWARLECEPNDPGLVPAKQNQFRETGQIPMMGHVWPRYWSPFDDKVAAGEFGVRKL